MRSRRWAASRSSSAPAGSTTPRARRSRAWAPSRTACCATTCGMPDGSVRDTVVFSIIESEWPAVKQQPRLPARARDRSSGRDARPIGIVGARGYVGAELIRLIAAHPRLRAGVRVLARAGRAARRRHIEPTTTATLRYSYARRTRAAGAGRRRAGAGAAERQGGGVRRGARRGRAPTRWSSTCRPTTASTTAGTTACRS